MTAMSEGMDAPSHGACGEGYKPNQWSPLGWKKTFKMRGCSRCRDELKGSSSVWELGTGACPRCDRSRPRRAGEGGEAPPTPRPLPLQAPPRPPPALPCAATVRPVLGAAAGERVTVRYRSSADDFSS